MVALARDGIERDPRELAEIPNLWFRTATGRIERTERRVLPSLDGQPAPDYSDYFSLADCIGIARTVLVLPVEASRGCAWADRGHGATGAACSFCSLNRSWPGYREKSLPLLLKELRECIHSYGVLDFSFVDSSLPASFRDDLLRAIASWDEDVSLFCELRADFDETTAALLARAGARKVQIGVESFSSTSLRRMGKGLQAIDNVAAIRRCHEFAIPYQYNLLTDIPGAGQEEIAENLAILPLLRGFLPPTLVAMYVGRDSAIARNPAAWGIQPASIDAVPCRYVPASLSRAGLTEEVSFVASSADAPSWAAIVREVNAWRAFRASGLYAPLSYRVGPEFVVIEDRTGPEPCATTLTGIARDVFLAAESVSTVSQVAERCSSAPAELVGEAVDQLVAARLLLRERSRVIALPVRLRRSRVGETSHADLRAISLDEQPDGRDGVPPRVSPGARDRVRDSRPQHREPAVAPRS